MQPKVELPATQNFYFQNIQSCLFYYALFVVKSSYLINQVLAFEASRHQFDNVTK